MSDDVRKPSAKADSLVLAENADGALDRVLSKKRAPKYGRFVFAALSSIPWVGGIIAASSALHAEFEQGRVNELVAQWLDEHRRKINQLGSTLEQMADRLDSLGEKVEERLNDEYYLSLVRQGFRIWDEASTETKRDYVRKCLTNAAATKICSDDVVRMFLAWIAKYDEAHFQVVKVLYHNPGATRGQIWNHIYGEEVRENSAEADLFRLLIFDLNTGRVLRQTRATNASGQFIAKPPRRRRPRKTVLESAFDNSKTYELTALGSQFVHYVMEETVPRIGPVSQTVNKVE